MRQELDVSTHFGVLVESGSGKLLKPRSGACTGPRVRSTLGHLKPGTYKLAIRALPPGKKRVLGPNPLTLQLGRSRVLSVHRRISRGNGRDVCARRRTTPTPAHDQPIAGAAASSRPLGFTWLVERSPRSRAA